MASRLIVGNWKMHNTVSQAETFVQHFLSVYHHSPTLEVALAPPFIALHATAKLLEATTVQLAAQNVFYEDQGAFTGEISPLMLKELGCRYVIIGHSERRHLFGETDLAINKKIKAALRHHLYPIFCVGEQLADRTTGKTTQVIQQQVASGLDGVCSSDLPRLTLAYEPVWAIGTGHAATVEQAVEVHRDIRRFLGEQFGTGLDRLRILYGGSVSPENAEALFQSPAINGALIGKACLNPQTFVKIITLAGQSEH